MSKARLVITAIEVEGRSPAEVIAAYGVSRSWLYELLARYRAEGAVAHHLGGRHLRGVLRHHTAEGVGFEPTKSCELFAVFKTAWRGLPRATTKVLGHDRPVQGHMRTVPVLLGTARLVLAWLQYDCKDSPKP